MQITRSKIETRKGPADWFTGDVYIDTIEADETGSPVTWGEQVTDDEYNSGAGAR